MRIIYIELEEKDYTREMLDDLYYFINESGNRVYDLGFVIRGKRIYKAYYEDKNTIKFTPKPYI